ncbi:MAG: hypothetical protein VX835_01035 [Pseudomonadota bacterium]|nr:hypothetical protein [Pseudomonadota bacterium]
MDQTNKQTLQSDDLIKIDFSILFRFIALAYKEIFFSILTLCLSAMVYFYFFSYSWQSNIRLVQANIFEAEKYIENNQDGYFKIDQKSVYDIFVASLKDSEKLEQFIIDSNVVDKKKYSNHEKYIEQIRLLSNRIKLSEITILEDKKTIKTGQWVLSYNGFDDINIKQLMVGVIKSANEFTRQFLLDRYDRQVYLKNKYDEYKSHDLKTEIKNAHDDYKRQTYDRIEFLTEQAKIARSLNISNNTLETMDFNSGEKPVVTTLLNEKAIEHQPYYLHGYVSIEKEIELIKNRKIDTPFIPVLFEKETAQRSIDQDLTIERSKDSIKTSPLFTKEHFKAIDMSGINQTNLKLLTNTNVLYLYLLFAVIMGICLGLIIHHLPNYYQTLKKNS